MDTVNTVNIIQVYVCLLFIIYVGFLIINQQDPVSVMGIAALMIILLEISARLKKSSLTFSLFSRPGGNPVLASQMTTTPCIQD